LPPEVAARPGGRTRAACPWTTLRRSWPSCAPEPATLHDRTEAAFVLGDPARVTRAVYADVLARLARHLAAAEAALAPWAPTLAGLGIDLAERGKQALLARDLDAVRPPGAPPSPPGTPPPPPASGGADAALPAAPTLAHAFGLLYVLEGATLGGQLLRRRLGPALDLTAEQGLAFFGAYGSEVGPMWRAFTDALARFDAATPAAERPAAHAAALDAARAAFLAFERDVVAPTAAGAASSPALASA
jgi:heme oxygenase